MGIQHNENVPVSFADALSGSYLGDPEVVSTLVATFCTGVEQTLSQLQRGEISKEQFDKGCNEAIRHYADIFSARDPGYKPIVGYHGQTLNYKLMADLGEFWRKQRGKWNDDSVAVLFEKLLVNLAESLKRSDGDDMLLGVMMRPTMDYTVGVLLGTEKRQGRE